MRRPLPLAILLLGLFAPAATARRAEPLVIRAGAHTVVVDRASFRLRVFGASRTPILSEVANRNPASSALAPMSDPVAPGTEPAQSGQLYAPLSFLVGHQSITQHAGSVWGGNLMSGVRSGTQYAARRVRAVRWIRGGVELTVSTSDPSGRVLRVRILTAPDGVMRIAVRPVPSRGVALMSDAFTSSAGEAFHGFGGRHNALNQHGQALANFVEEENITRLGTPGTPSGVLYPNGPTAAYYPQAQFVSSHGYGFLLDQPQLSWFRLDSDRPDAWSVAVTGASLNYVVAPGQPAEALHALTGRSGRQPAPPAWALGPMMDRLVKNSGETEADYVAALHADLADLRRYRMPLSAYRIEGWGFRSHANDGLALPSFVDFRTQTSIITALRGRGIHPLAYLRPLIMPGSAPDRARLTVRSAAGGTFLTTTTTGEPITLLDFTNPAAVRYWRREVTKVLNLGFDGFMADFGEEVLAGMHFADGASGLSMHNRYVILYLRATREAVAAFERTHPRRQIWFFNRAGYSGTPGSTAFEGGNFPGDEATDWSPAAGLASSTPDMLNRAIGGAYGYGTDIGGYFDYSTPPTTKELFLRWAEWAALSPIFRLHGSGRAGTHTAWSYDAQTVRAYRALSRLHEQAAPLILRLWRAADRTGMPPTRPLWLEFPGDRRAAAQTQEWTLGDDVLVAPVVTDGARHRAVYFPAGCWRDPQTGITHRGAGSARVAAPLTRLLYFVRCGTRPLGT